MELVAVALVGAVLYALIWMTCNLLTVRKVRIENDDGIAKAVFVDILGSAERTLLVRDDGDRASTLYYDNDVLEQVRAKLLRNRRLAIKVLFNCREAGNKLAAMQEEKAYRNRDRLDVRYLSPQRRRAGEVHAKIADGGTTGCLSVHEPGAQERSLEKFDCSRSWLGRQFVFRRAIADFNRDF